MRFQTPLGVVTPSLDGEVLAVLAAADGWFTAPRITAQLDGRSTEGVRRVLARLVGEGIVERESASVVPLYRLNRDHLAAPAIVALAAQRDEFLTRLHSVIGSWPIRVRYAAVFGSAARGSMRIDSDIDLLVVRPDQVDDSWGSALADLAESVLGWTGNELRILEFGEGEVTLGAEPVLQDVVDQGITVFGDRAWFRRAVMGR